MNTLTNESAAAILLFEAVESELTNQSELATPIELENQSSSTEQNSTAEGEQFINRPITPNYTIGIGRAKKTAHQTKVELKKRARKQQQQIKLMKKRRF